MSPSSPVAKCSACGSSCDCYFSHKSLFACHTKTCVLHRPREHALVDSMIFPVVDETYRPSRSRRASPSRRDGDAYDQLHANRERRARERAREDEYYGEYVRPSSTDRRDHSRPSRSGSSFYESDYEHEDRDFESPRPRRAYAERPSFDERPTSWAYGSEHDREFDPDRLRDSFTRGRPSTVYDDEPQPARHQSTRRSTRRSPPGSPVVRVELEFELDDTPLPRRPRRNHGDYISKKWDELPVAPFVYVSAEGPDGNVLEKGPGYSRRSRRREETHDDSGRHYRGRYRDPSFYSRGADRGSGVYDQEPYAAPGYDTRPRSGTYRHGHGAPPGWI